MNIILKIVINALAVFGAAYILPGVHVSNFATAVVVAIVLSVLNFLVKPVLVIFTIPITIITLGLFLFIINAIIVKLCAGLVDDFEVNSWLYAILFSLVVSLFAAIMEKLAN